MSEEIIKVLDYIGDKLGIAIDWSSENVWPYVMDVLGRYRIMEIVINAIWVVVLTGMTIAMITLLCKSTRWALIEKHGVWYDDYYQMPSILSLVTWILSVVAICIMIPFVIVCSNNILNWSIVPEIKYLNMLQSYIQ